MARAWAAVRCSRTRAIALPRGLLHAGDNSITVNVFCSWKNCGLTGPASTRAIRLGRRHIVALDQPWHYKPVDTLIAPQIPWGPMHGVGLQYGGMIKPIGPYGVKGAIWYQGESNIYFAQTYQPALTAMMADWRKQFGAILPFMIVQIPDYGPTPTQPDGVAMVGCARGPAQDRRSRRRMRRWW